MINKEFFPVSYEEFKKVLALVPKGKLVTVNELLKFFQRLNNGKLMYMDFPQYIQHKDYDQVPWWRIIRENGELFDDINNIMRHQFVILEKALADLRGQIHD